MLTKSVLDEIPSVDTLSLQGKNVFLRLDLNLPIHEGQIVDDTRLQAALPTLKFIRESGARLVIGSHLGRPKKIGDMSMEPIAQALGDILDCEALLVEDPVSEAPKALLKGLRPNQIVVLENLRWSEQETNNGQKMSETIASYTDVYVNDAFGACHRAHASISGVPLHVDQKAMGFLIQKEVQMLEKVLTSSESPFVAILGGAKVSDKMPVIEKLMETVDTFILGGAMASTFLAAKGVSVGRSLVEKDKLHFTERLIKRLEIRGKKLLLPVDHIASLGVDDLKNIRTTKDDAVLQGEMCLDIGPKSRALFQKELQTAKFVFWNGPMGVFETKAFSQGSFVIAEALAKVDGTVIVGGGDSAAVAKLSGFAEKMDHISTGGGASLEFLQGSPLPGLEALKNQGNEQKGGFLDEP